jgi:hypothetical protein
MGQEQTMHNGPTASKDETGAKHKCESQAGDDGGDERRIVLHS